MRLSLWLILILAFSIGMGCAFALRDLYFDAKPVAAKTCEPHTKILVAKRTIPSGVEITADFLIFQKVAVSEAPRGSISSFAQVYRRQPAYPIPAGCPICEDLLLPEIEAATEIAFVPTGSQFVTLDVAHIWQGSKVIQPKEPLSTLLDPDQRVDIRIVPKEDAQGRLAEIKQEVLRTFGARDIRNSGELVLENVPIHRTQRQFTPHSAGSVRDSIMLMLDKSEVAKLTEAAKKGQIRVLVRHNEKTAPEPARVETSLAAMEPSKEIRELPPAPLPAELPLPQSVPMDIPLTLEQSPIPMVSSSSAVPIESVQRVTPIPANDSDPMLSSDPGFNPFPLVRGGESPQRLNRFDQQPDNLDASVLPELEGEEKVSIRNDVPIVSFGGKPPSRVVPSEHSEESLPVQPLMPLTDESEEGAFPSSSSEVLLGPPRVTQSIQFIFPSSVTSAGEYPREMVRRTDVVIPSVAPLIVPSAVPTVLPVLTAPQERTGMSGYSPFERRIYTVLPSEGSEQSSGKDMLAPPRLQKSSDVETRTK